MLITYCARSNLNYIEINNLKFKLTHFVHGMIRSHFLLVISFYGVLSIRGPLASMQIMRDQKNMLLSKKKKKKKKNSKEKSKKLLSDD